MRVQRKANTPNGITMGMLSVIIIAMSITLILTLVKIYFSNQIYLESKEVNRLYRQAETLRAEQKILQQNVEALKFKNEVTDTIFVIKDE